ncbi:MAG: hypothetical protein IH616_17505, partial [Gemmatimonadales bacterium]|nr:hypothetical protein [Gemmatimonadales bacterium]
AASRYLAELVELGILRALSSGREKLFINPNLLQLLMNEERDAGAGQSAA